MIFEFFLASLAAWRIAYLITNEDGPFDLLISLRVRMGAYDFNEKGIPKSWTGRGISCIQCMTWWVGILCGIIVLLGYGIYLLPFAVSALALYIHRLIRRE